MLRDQTSALELTMRFDTLGERRWPDETRNVTTLRRVLITGATGFVGSHVAAAFRTAGTHVVELAREHREPDDTVLVSDLSDAQELAAALRERTVDTVVHCAWTGHPRSSGVDYEAQVESNISTATNTLLAAGMSDVEQVILLSSGGALAEPALLRRHDPPAYGWAKRVVESTAVATAEAFGYVLTVVRPTAVYGPGQDPAKGLGAISVFAQQLLTGQPIHVFGSLDTARDFLHVDDLADAIVALAVERSAGTFEVGGPELVSLRALIDMLQSEIGQRAIVEVTMPTGLDRESVLLDSTGLLLATGSVPHRTVGTSVRDVVIDVAHRLGVAPPDASTADPR